MLDSARSASNVYIAVAFFTEVSVVEELVASGCNVRLIVRLGFPTNPYALERLMANPRVQMRYFTGHSFHPKLYIFGDEIAFVGSANLTGSAILTNQEIVVGIGRDDDRFTELVYIFSEYWQESRVLHDDDLKSYKQLFNKFQQHQAAAEQLGQKILNQLGDFSPTNITRETPKLTSQGMYLEDFRKTYQESLSAFNVVRDAYEATGYRKADDSLIPLRLEIDSFISFVRERKAQGDAWRQAPLRSVSEQAKMIGDLVREWRETPWEYFERTVVHETYPRLMKVFESPDSLKNTPPEKLFDALCTLHSFHDRFRFFEGGMSTWKSTFVTVNDAKKVYDSLSYLVFGSDRVEQRMANLIFNPQYKLSEFGRANVQELIGWCNREQLPVINGRTTKVLRFLGSEVAQL
ncbi:phospholipase D family protein [Burkholderia theae]|uniref:phospholipase D family protein n=1 Tax=Burkholderia theae TaxID=3143496 RepID=UPI003AFB3E07